MVIHAPCCLHPLRVEFKGQQWIGEFSEIHLEAASNGVWVMARQFSLTSIKCTLERRRGRREEDGERERGKKGNEMGREKNVVEVE